MLSSIFNCGKNKIIEDPVYLLPKDRVENSTIVKEPRDKPRFKMLNEKVECKAERRDNAHERRDNAHERRDSERERRDSERERRDSAHNYNTNNDIYQENMRAVEKILSRFDAIEKMLKEFALDWDRAQTECDELSVSLESIKTSLENITLSMENRNPSCVESQP